MLRQWAFAAGRNGCPAACVRAYDDESLRTGDATVLRGEPGALHLEFARTLACGGDWRDLVPGGRAGSALPGAAGPVAADSCRAVRRSFRFAFAFCVAARRDVSWSGSDSPAARGRSVRVADRARRVSARAPARSAAGQSAAGAGSALRLSRHAEHSGVFGVRDFFCAQHYFSGAEPAPAQPQAGRRRLAVSGARCAGAHDAQQRADRLRFAGRRDDGGFDLGAPPGGAVLGWRSESDRHGSDSGDLCRLYVAVADRGVARGARFGALHIQFHVRDFQLQYREPVSYRIFTATSERVCAQGIRRVDRAFREWKLFSSD